MSLQDGTLQQICLNVIYDCSSYLCHTCNEGSEKSKESDIKTLIETDTRLAEDIMECLVPLRDMTTAICTEQTPTVSIIQPLIQIIKRIMTTKETDTSITTQIKEAVTSDLATRYASEEMQNFLEECAVLGTGFKDSYFESDKQYTIYNRLAAICSASVGNVQVKVEPGPQAVETPAPEFPQLHQLLDVDQS